MNTAKLQAYRRDFMAFADDLRIPSAHGPRRFAACMADFQQKRFGQLAPALHALAAGEKPPIGRYWWEATKGASKDSDLAVAVLWLLAFVTRPLLIQVGAADQDQADELRKAAKDVLALNPWLAQRVEVQNWRIVCEATGGTVEIIAADTAGSHGARPDVLILNELSHVTKQEFAENLIDNAAKVPQGLVVIATNAGFVGTWQYKWRELARHTDRWIFNQYAQPSPWLDAADIAEAEQRNSRSRFLRLWRGVWSSGTGDALDADDVQACIVEAGPMLGFETGYAFGAGLDLGIKNDHSALVVIAKTTTGRLRLASCEAWAPSPLTGQVDLLEVQAAVVAAHKRFRLGPVNFDPHQAQLMAQQCRALGVSMIEIPFVGKTLDQMASLLLNEFRSRNVALYPDQLLIRDLGRLSIIEKSYGYKLESTRDADGHADRGTALTLAILAAKSAPIVDTSPIIWDLEAIRELSSGRRTFRTY